MVAISTNNMASIFLSHNHIFHQDYLKYSQLLPLWLPHSLRSWAPLILPLNIKPTFTYSHPILSPIFTEEINFSKELSVFVVSISSPLTHSWHTNQHRFRSSCSLTVAIVKVTIKYRIIKFNEHVSVLILLFRNIWSSAHSLILIC